MADAYKFKTNVPVKVEFKYDEPKTGEGDFGTWWLYGVVIDGASTNFFATGLLHQTLLRAGIKKGTTAVIAKIEDDEDAKKVYWSVSVGKNVYTSKEAMAGEPPKQTTKTVIPDVKPSISDFVRTIIECYKKTKDESERVGIKLSEDALQKLATSVFIEARKVGLNVSEGAARTLNPIGYPEPVPPPEDDLPF